MDHIKKPKPEDYGYEPKSGFESEGGWTIEGGEEAYYAALQKFKSAPTLNTLAQQCHQTAKDKGFWDNENSRRSIGELLMLVTSELAEALEADRKGRYCAYIREEEKRAMEVIDGQEQYAAQFITHIKDTFEDEIADAIIRLLDLCAHCNIDIDFHVRAKMRYNQGRERLHGKKY